MKNHFTSASSFSAEIPYSNTFNNRCDICSHPISQSDINVLQPCFCGPFHSYCITNLELNTRDAHPEHPNPHLTCPRCRQTVTAINYDFLYDHPRASRPPFTVAIQPSSHKPVLPVSIHDTCPIPPNPTSDGFTSLPHYPKPTTPYRPSQTDFTPTAPPLHIHDPVPPPHLFTSQPPHTTQPPSRPVPSLHTTLPSNFSTADPSTPHPNKPIHLPSPHNAVPRSPPLRNTQTPSRSHLHHPNSTKNSPNTIVISRQVNEDDVRKGLYGDDVYKAYVQGKATVLSPTHLSKSRKPQGKDLTVKVEMDLHIYHHYTPVARSTDSSHERRTVKHKDRRKMRPADKPWWKSPRTTSKLDRREEYHADERYSIRGGVARRS